MKDENKKKNVIFWGILVVVIAILVVIFSFMNKEKIQSNNTNTSSNEFKYQESVLQNTTTNAMENQMQTEPKDPVDDEPTKVIETPTEGQTDKITTGQPTM